jgi:plasmid stabilization system protein ParE
VRVVLLPQAQEDLDEIVEPLLARVLRQIENLVAFPLMGVAMRGPFEGWRSPIADRFRVIYCVQGEVIQVAYVRDGHRQPLERP